MSKSKKILNDPLYGFISIPDGIIFDIIEHRWFQRLRRINQLGLTNLVYSGANHTRFQHTLGAYHLINQAIANLRMKGVAITDEEAEAAGIAILMHDIGHGPFSHTLEHSLIENTGHEKLSGLFMERMNNEMDGKLTMAIRIFNNTYPKKFLHQLVSSQLDVDRLDYLMRDSFFTGVSEGVIGSDRILKMLDVKDDQLVIEAKGIYSIEKFIIARRLMYWQVYLHKTVLSAENLLVKIMQRATLLGRNGHKLFGSPALQFFLEKKRTLSDFEKRPDVLEKFALLDDFDILGAIKVWQNDSDTVLSTLSKMLINRNLFKLVIDKKPFTESALAQKADEVVSAMNIGMAEAGYFVFTGRVENRAYSQEIDNITILHKDGSTIDVASDADLLNISALSEPVVKYFLCYPKVFL